MPAHNHAAFVEAALNSVAAQSYPEIELIVIDDGSSDDTAEVIARCLARFSRSMRVEFLRQPNRGLGPTLAHALTLVRGKYVQFLASDDAIFPKMTERLVAALGQLGPEVAAVYCDGYVYDGRAKPHRLFSDVHPSPISRNQHRELLVGNWFPPMGLLYRRDMLEKVGGFDPDLAYEDWGLLLSMTRRYRIAQIPDRLFLYRQHGQNSSADPDRMRSALQALTARFPAMASVRDLRAAIAARDFRRIVAGLTSANLELAARFGLRQIQLRSRAGGKRPLGDLFRRKQNFGRFDEPGAGRVQVGPGCTIHPDARLESGPGALILGEGCHIGADVRLIAGPGLTIGAGSFVEAGAQIGGAARPTSLGRACLIAAGTRIEAGADLGDMCVTMPESRISGSHPDGRWLLPDTAKGVGTNPPDGNTF